MKSDTLDRMHDGYPVAALPSPWWTIVGLYSGAWYEIYQFRSEADANRNLGVVMDDTSSCHDRYEDFAVLAPSHQHEVPKGNSQAASWWRANSPATAAKRLAAASEPVPPSTRGRRGSTTRRKSR